MLAAPMATPLIVGWVVGAVAPAGTVTVELLSFTLVVSLLTSVTTTPFGAGAGMLRLTGNVASWPTLTLTGLDGKIRNGGRV